MLNTTIIQSHVYLETTSHRSRDKLDRAIDRHPQYYYTWKLGGCIAKVTTEEYNKILKDGKISIKGITKYRGKDEPSMCWSVKNESPNRKRII